MTPPVRAIARREGKAAKAKAAKTLQTPFECLSGSSAVRLPFPS
ncbi:hypothetical protein [Paraburkholderia caffeinitolerans]|nr:hypothetical protein [Paraburkholderia caffeinitolerans]